jgi:tRNA pseudouridine32 synthase/23S rRNA pseudouridine746 synthase
MPAVMFDLVASDPRFFVIDKHSGCSFHHQGDEPGLVESVRQQCGAVWPVHRLDRMTSGLMLLARSPEVARQLSERLAAHQIDKLYLALSDQKPSKKQGLVQGDMQKGRGGAWRLCPTRVQPAITQFQSTSLAPGLRLFFLKPLSGKTHQLRVALKSLGAPIIGDPLYHATVAPPPDRGYLHAWSLRFELDGEQLAFLAPPRHGELFISPTFQSLIALPQWQPPALQWPIRKP